MPETRQMGQIVYVLATDLPVPNINLRIQSLIGLTSERKLDLKTRNKFRHDEIRPLPGFLRLAFEVLC